MSDRPCGRRLAVRVALGLSAIAIGAGVGAAAPADEKADVDRKLQQSRQQLEAARGRERVLTDEVGGLTARIRVLEQKLAPLRAEADRLEGELAALRDRLSALTGRLQQEQERLQKAMIELKRRRDQLGERLRQLYVRGEPNAVMMFVEAGSLSQVVETQDALQAIAERDKALADSVAEYADDVRATRDRIAEVRAEVVVAEERAEVAARKANEAKAGLERQQSRVKSVADRRTALLSRVRGDRQHIEVETKGLEARSARLQAQIVKAQQAAAAQAAASSGSSSSSQSLPASSGSGASSSGFTWPTSGVLTSNFGWRWGRMHQGIDIGAGSGTPIVAASSGTVIIAGWNGGYGQLVVVDHGGGVSTAYAHQSAIVVSVGQSVGQGTMLGRVGSTGNSTGPHLHFEVRINGAAVNPLGYL